MVFAVLGEVFPHKLDKQFTNICFHILTIWWVEPYNLPVSISSSVLSIAIIVRYWWKMSIILYCWFVDAFNLVELFFITRQIWNSLADHFRQLLDGCRWVVRKGVDVEWCVVSLSKRKVFLSRKVEGNIYKICFYKISFDGDWKSFFLE